MSCLYRVKEAANVAILTKIWIGILEKNFYHQTDFQT